MAHLVFVLPSPALARLTDPLTEAAALRAEGRRPTWTLLLERVTARVADAVAPVVRGVPTGRDAGSTSWYALAPALLDADDVTCLTGATDAVADGSLLRQHVEQLAVLRSTRRGGDEAPGLPPRPDDLVDVLALAGLAGPPSVAFRALSRTFPGATDLDLVAEAARVAGAFRSLLNSPDANAAIDAFDRDSEFWRASLRYCAAGNLQSVMDEYCAVLAESRGYDRAQDRLQALHDLATDITGAMAFRTPLYRPAVVAAGDESGPPRWRQLRMRGRFAMRYGAASTQEKVEQRADQVARAFNSPFWPFVLATTSIGQEGLDFHQYCHAVSHWNLPGNPVDLEQREGRVHRYKGHAVRKNVARTAGFPLADDSPWERLFSDVAADCKGSDIAPFWVFAPDSLGQEAARIERHLPFTPYTRETSLLGPLLESVGLYRLAFGQPRQEDLVRILADEIDEKTLRSLLDIRVDLAPPRRAQVREA